ncbi:MAG: tyrosine-type recombinase/integrase [bacterium]|nr:tyrosine-type recombinase/integrase [bacterium]
MALVEDYLALRRGAGFKLKATGYRLRSFARFASAKADTHVRIETALAWAASATSPRQRHVRLRDLVIFARHLRAEDPRHELPEGSVFPRPRGARLPHIFSDEEIARILAAADRLGPAASSRPDTIRTLFGLLAATGMRIGEALRLKLEDHTSDGLRIRNTKFRKSRLIPLHDTTESALAVYRSRWRVGADPSEPVFVSTRGTALGPDAVFTTFDKIVRAEGLRWDVPPGENRRPSPALRDFRHTFAVRSLEACPESRAAIDRHMLALTTYLGHVSVASTYWYLQATPHLMTDIADACEAWRLGGHR